MVKILISLKVLEIMGGWVSQIPWLVADEKPDLLLWLVSKVLIIFISIVLKFEEELLWFCSV